MSVPYPDPIVIELISRLPAVAETTEGRVSVVLDSLLPAIRIAKVGDAEAPSTYEGTPVFRVEVWADDEFVAGDIAWRIKNSWPTAKREVVLDGLVHGRWVDADPRTSPDPETEKPRYLIDLGIRLSGVSS